MATFDELVNQIDNNLDNQRDRGTAFEKMVVAYLKNDQDVLNIIEKMLRKELPPEAYINGLYGEVGSDLADETAIRLLLPNKLSDQICFKSENSLQLLSFIEAKEVVIDEN